MYPADLSPAGIEQFQSSVVEKLPTSWEDVAKGEHVELACLQQRQYVGQARPWLHYLSWDRSEDKISRPAILLVHGIMDYSYRWNVVGPVLAECFKTLVIAPDLPGRGRSSFASDGSLLVEARPVSQGHSGDDYVQVLDEFVQRMLPRERKLWVVGHSMGGALAFLFAAKFPELVDRLALLSPAGHMSSMATLRCCLKFDCYRSCVHRIMGGDQTKVLKDDFKDWNHATFKYFAAYQGLQKDANTDHFLDPLLGCAMQFPLYGLEREVQQFVTRDGWKRPLLLMFGRHDTTVPFATMEGWSRSLSSGRPAKPSWLVEHVVEEGAHAFFWERPGESIQVLIDFLAS